MISARRFAASLILGIVAWRCAAAETTAPANSPSLSATDPARLVLAAGTRVPMRTITPLSTLSNHEGDRFDLYVSEDVFVGGHVVIARGSRGVGEITHLDPKGAFGKSGKMNVVLRWVEAGETRVPVDGKMQLRGASGTGPTVTSALLIGVDSFLITGKSATLPADTKVIGYVSRDLPIELRPARTTTTPPLSTSAPLNPPLTSTK